MKKFWMWGVALIATASGCVDDDQAAITNSDSQAIAALPLPIQIVNVAADGTLSPQNVTIAAGTSVQWNFTGTNKGVVPTVGNSCTPKAYRYGNPDDFTGPMPHAPGGVFALSPDPDGTQPGLVEVPAAGSCAHPNDEIMTAPTGEHLCRTGPVQTVMDATWQDPAINGVFIRLAWNLVSPSKPFYNPITQQNSYTWNFADLDREVDKAVANGKLYTIGIEAGRDGTPDWIFNEDVVEAADGSLSVGASRLLMGGGVPRLIFQHHTQENTCGQWMSLGLPQNASYKAHYFAMLNAVAAHLKENAARYRALAYVKLSGANLYTAENRLPNQCESITDASGATVNCHCNTEAWAKGGYTPSGLKQFYVEQEDVITAAFPTKNIIYPLLQAGFPLVDDTGAWQNRSERWMRQVPCPTPLPGNCVLYLPTTYTGITGTETTEDILEDGYARLGTTLLPQHCGLQEKPATCPGTGCPNYLVVRADPDQYTAFQTQNLEEITTLAGLDSAFQNGLDNSDAGMIEIYEEMQWLASKTPGALNPAAATPRTLANWNSTYKSVRNQEIYGPLLTPGVLTSYRYQFATAKTYYYTVPGTCGAAGTIGKITVQ
jgi:hypothetical protein